MLQHLLFSHWIGESMICRIVIAPIRSWYCFRLKMSTMNSTLKGLFTIFLFSVRSNILNINELRSHMAPWVEVPGDKIKTQKIEFGAFIGPSGQNQLYHTPLLLKIWDLTKNKKIVNNPFKWLSDNCWQFMTSSIRFFLWLYIANISGLTALRRHSLRRWWKVFNTTNYPPAQKMEIGVDCPRKFLFNDYNF